MNLALLALTAGAFGIGVTEFVIMGLLLDISKDLGVSIALAGLLISGYAIGVVIGVPLGTWVGQAFGWRATFWLVTLVGVIAVTVLSFFVPRAQVAPETVDWKVDLKAMARRPVLLGLLTTVLGYAGVFAVFTYIAPILTQISGFAESAVSPILLLFGLGLAGGNLLGGKLAGIKTRWMSEVKRV